MPPRRSSTSRSKPAHSTAALRAAGRRHARASRVSARRCRTAITARRISTSKPKPPLPKYVALLRGINVGGKSLIKMAALKECVEAIGHGDVRTYIASGHVLFESKERSGPKLDAQLERAIEKAFGLPVRVVVRSGAELQRIVDRI